MKRRDFLSITLPATGVVLMTPALLNSQAFAEINRQFSGKSDFDAYDVVINGAGLSGYFAALEAWNDASVYQQAIAKIGTEIDGR